MNAAATFVMPYYGDRPGAIRYLDRAVAGLYAQTDPDWQLVIVDDASPRAADRARLRALQAADPERVYVLTQPVNEGQGAGRNRGVAWAHERGSQVILFHDADDLSHPDRLARTQAVFAAQPEVDFVYSTFSVIDEDDAVVPRNRLTPSVAEILESHTDPVEGYGAWIRIGTETGYTTLTSTVAVRLSLALAHPFPRRRGCEDAPTWLAMSAGGAYFGYLADVPGQYRIPQWVTGSADRSRFGSDYYRRKVEVETEGFDAAVAIARRRGTLDPARVPVLQARFLRRLAVTLDREGHPAIAAELRRAADRSAALVGG